MIKIRFVDPDKKPRAKAHPVRAVPADPAIETPELTSEEQQEKEEEIAALLATESTNDPAAEALAHSELAASEHGAPISETERAWLHALHWRSNPFQDIALEPFRSFFVGRQDARRALGLIVRGEGRFAVIEGPRGTGTTSLLRWLGEELAEHTAAFRIISIRAPVSLADLTKLLTDPYKGFLSSYRGSTNEELALYLAKREKRRIVLLVDDADALGPLEATLKELVQHPNVVIALAGRSPTKLRDPNVLVTLSRLDHASSIEFVSKRIESVGGMGTHPLSTDQLTDLWQDAQGDLHTFLKACALAAQEAALRPTKSTTEDAILNTAHEHARAHAKEHAHEAAPQKRSRFDSLIEGLEQHSKK